jgi:hypothetical protein
VAASALPEVALAIQRCLVDVLNRHRLLEGAYRQHIAGLEDELATASRRADDLQALVGESDAAAVHLERRVAQLTGLLRDQQLHAERLAGECQDLQLRQLPALAPAQSPIPVHCFLQQRTPAREDASPYQWTSPPSSPAQPRDERFGSGSPSSDAGRHFSVAPTPGHTGSAALAAHVEQLNDLQSRFEAATAPANHSREHEVKLSEFASVYRGDFYVLPDAVPVGASKLPGPRVELKSAEKLVGFDKSCVKLFTTATDPGFLSKSLRYFEGLDLKLRSWGLAELLRLLLTRRVRVIVDSHSSAGDFSRIMQMLQASSQPYSGLNRLCPFWLVATRDLDRRRVVYVDASVLINLDAVLMHVFVTYADDAATQRIFSKCAPSASAYVAWLELCNYPFTTPGFSETILRTQSRNYLDTQKWDSRKLAFPQWEQDLCAAIRCHNFLFPSAEFLLPSAYLDYLWFLVGTERTRRCRPQVDLQYDDASFENAQLALRETDLPRYIGRMARALKDSDEHPVTGVSVGNVKVDVAAVMSQLKQLKQSVGASAARPAGVGAAAACKYCEQTPCRGVCTNCLECTHTLGQCLYPGGPKHDPTQHVSKQRPTDYCLRCRVKGHRAHSCLKLKLKDVQARAFERLSSAEARAFSIERAGSAQGAARQARGAAAHNGGAHSVGVRDGSTGTVKRAFVRNPPKAFTKPLTKRLVAMIDALDAGDAPAAPAPSAKQPSQHEVDVAFVQALEAQFAQHAKTIGAVFVFGADPRLGEIARSPPYFGSMIVEVNLSTPQTVSDLVRAAMRAGDFYMIDGGSPLHIIPTRHALRGCTLLKRGSLRQSGVRVRGFLANSQVTAPLLCGEVSLKFHESLHGGIHAEKVLCYFSDETDIDLYSELSLVRTHGFSMLECSDPAHLPAWTHSYAAKFSTGNRFLVKNTAAGYVALEHTPAGDKYTGMYSLSPQCANFALFRQLCSTHESCHSLDTLPCQTISLDRERAFYAAASTDACHDSVSVSSVMFPAMDDRAGSCESALQRLATETAAAHCAGADELPLAALALHESGLSSVSDLRVPDGLVPAVVCSRCEQPGCRADVCPRPCRLCDSAHGHESSCLRFDFKDGTITRFASTADAMEELSSIGIQAVYPSAAPPADAPEVSGAAAAPALSTEDLALLRRVRPLLLKQLSRVNSVPRTANGTPLQLVFDELPLGQRFELCRLFDRAHDLRHGSTIRDSAQAAFGKLCQVVAAGFNAST